jgi:hypothetical protein
VLARNLFDYKNMKIEIIAKTIVELDCSVRGIEEITAQIGSS